MTGKCTAFCWVLISRYHCGSAGRPTEGRTNSRPRCETCAYSLSPRGLDLSAAWKLDVQASPLRQLRVLLDPGLQFVSARLGESEIPFTTAGDESPAAVVLELPEPLAGSDRSLRLAAIGPLSTGAAWRLPRIRASDVMWQEGTCTLLVHEPLVISRLVTDDCRQTKYSLLPEPNRGESFEVQLFSVASTVEVSLMRQLPHTRLSTGTRVELGDDTARAEIRALVEPSSGRRTAIAADVMADWVIDSVDCVPREALAGWRIDMGAEPSRLTAYLARPLPASESVKLIVHGHRVAPGGGIPLLARR